MMNIENGYQSVKDAPDRTPRFTVSLAGSQADVRAGQALRYLVFVEELGAQASSQDHADRLERDRFDPFADHLLLRDETRPVGDQVVGVYRLMDRSAAEAAGGFYSEAEYDLSVLRRSGRHLLEMGRSCLHREYRGGAGMWHLWQGLARVVEDRGADVLFGVASFPGTNVAELAPALSILARDHAAPPDLTARSQVYQDMALTTRIDKRDAMRQVPALIKAYLRLGGMVGDGAFIDRRFNTTDVCLILDLARMNPRQRALYGGGAPE
ncbi:MAG: GNAT family N-acyltransferase [Pseudomonadota bacterium]